MERFQKILVAVDFSAHSDQAVRVAATFARCFDAPLTITHVYDPLVYAMPDGISLVSQPQLERLFEALRGQLGEVQRQALDAGAPRVETKLLQGHVAATLVDCAASGKFDLIVIGTQGRTGVQHLLLGSIAERVVRLAPCPVLIAKKAQSLRGRPEK